MMQHSSGIIYKEDLTISLFIAHMAHKIIRDEIDRWWLFTNVWETTQTHTTLNLS